MLIIGASSAVIFCYIKTLSALKFNLVFNILQEPEQSKENSNVARNNNRG